MVDPVWRNVRDLVHVAVSPNVPAPICPVAVRPAQTPSQLGLCRWIDTVSLNNSRQIQHLGRSRVNMGLGLARRLLDVGADGEAAGEVEDARVEE